ncbi:MAG: acetyl-CoA hydrolase/transferase C-terminal domain-containing protein [Chloroflexota bacterium]|nr:acetyl-CoA hydrolase/transferase C-terminal domain-containing protein [Chloroflexota bacterium]
MDSFPKEVSAGEAVKAIESGSRVFLEHPCAEPFPLVEALLEGRERLRNVAVFMAASPDHTLLAQKGLEPHFRLALAIVGDGTREAVEQGRADHIPVRWFEIPRLFAPGGAFPLDVALIQVSPPDQNGFVSLGVIVDCALPAARSARIVIAEVNEKMPRTLGNSFLHLSEIHYMVRSSRPIPTLPPPKIGDAERAIAKYVAQLVPDGATLEFGIGTMPEAILQGLAGKKELGIHSGTLGDGIVDLVANGAVTNSRKRIDQGKMVTGGLRGTEKLYHFADNNALLEMQPVTYTHDPMVISQLDSFVAINSAVEIDLTGQVNAESLGEMQISGVGGQGDWVRGALLSRGGKSIIATTSTAGHGRVSRIVPRLKPGAVVTTPRYDVHYFVTEYGIAELWGKTVSQRAEALVSVAHPDFREGLRHSRE